MKRTIAFLGAVFLSLILAGTTAALAQQQPVSAADDTLSTTAEEAPPAPTGDGPMSMHADTTATARVRRGDARLMYYISLGIGSAINHYPESFKESYDPAFGVCAAAGVTRYGVRLGVNASYNFFFSAGPTTLYPDDLSILTIFGELKYVALQSTIRPYVFVCGGYYRQWIVNEDYLENVLGYGGGGGVEFEIDRVRHLFVEGSYIQGQTRERTERKVNTDVFPFRVGLTWVF